MLLIGLDGDYRLDHVTGRCYIKAGFLVLDYQFIDTSTLQHLILRSE